MSPSHRLCRPLERFVWCRATVCASHCARQSHFGVWRRQRSGARRCRAYLLDLHTMRHVRPPSRVAKTAVRPLGKYGGTAR